jgi:glucose-1-phosphate cytidylyltransferase
MKVAILCGGKGSRLLDLTNSTPKALLSVGKFPILYHIMNHYSSYGFNDFVLCLGFGAKAIKEYFLNMEFLAHDFQLNLAKNERKVHGTPEKWNIDFVDTGLDTMTGGRIKRIQKYMDSDFMATYGDGLSDINIRELAEFHKKQKKKATVTAVRHRSQYGILNMDGNEVTGFVEKPFLDSYINGGFFVFTQDVFDYLKNDSTILEQDPLTQLAKERQLAAFRHDGFWKSADTPKDFQELNTVWDSGNAPWKH